MSDGEQIILPEGREGDNSLLDRVGAHTHIKGLGLNDKLHALPVNDDFETGIVGQVNARRALGLLKHMLDGGKAAQAVLIAGPPASGKTALALAFAKSLSAEAPFVHLAASEVVSLKVGRTEVLRQAMRQAVVVILDEKKNSIVGEVEQLEIDKPTDKNNGRKSGRVTLRTEDMESNFEIGPKNIAQMQMLNVTAGDVISIDNTTGTVERLGRCMSRCAEYDVQASHAAFVQRPTGECWREEVKKYRVNLHDIDAVNASESGFVDVYSGNTGEIDDDVRDKVDERVKDLVEHGSATIVPGVIFIDESHMLDVGCYAFLNKAMEEVNAPILMLATNRGISSIRGGGGEQGAHAMPTDFLDRTMILHTDVYGPEERKRIIRVRAEAEGLLGHMEDGAVGLLCTAADQGGLRYALNLMGVAEKLRESRAERIAASVERKEAENDPSHITMEDVRRAVELFPDAVGNK